MLPQLTAGALDRIMSGEEVERPVFQVLGQEKQATSTCGDRYRLFVSDGTKTDSFILLATQLNRLITSDLLSQYAIILIRCYAITRVNVAGIQKPVMVILNFDILVPGHHVGKVFKPKPKGSFNNTCQASHAEAGNTLNKLSDLLSSGDGGISTTPIAALSPYHSRWIIKARVTNKTSIRIWSNSRGEGKLFNIDVLDASGEIRCTAFREQCDKFYDMIEIGKVYLITRGILKPANRQFNHLKNDYEMTIGNDAEIVICNEASQNVPGVQYYFIPIAAIERKQKDELIDVLGIVKFFSDVTSLIVQSTGQELKKRDLGIVDENNDLINFTLWGQQAIEFKPENHPVVAMKSVKVGEFQGGKNLSMVSSSSFHLNPDLPQAHRLHEWFEKLGTAILNHTRLTAFDEQARASVGASAQELGGLRDQSHDAYVQKMGEAASKSFIFELRRGQETYNDEIRLKTTAVSVQPINYRIYTNHLIDKIKELVNRKS